MDVAADSGKYVSNAPVAAVRQFLDGVEQHVRRFVVFRAFEDFSSGARKKDIIEVDG